MREYEAATLSCADCRAKSCHLGDGKYPAFCPGQDFPEDVMADAIALCRMAVSIADVVSGVFDICVRIQCPDTGQRGVGFCLGSIQAGCHDIPEFGIQVAPVCSYQNSCVISVSFQSIGNSLHIRRTFGGAAPDTVERCSIGGRSRFALIGGRSRHISGGVGSDKRIP